MWNNILLTQQKHTSFCNNKKYILYLVASIIIQSPYSYKYPQVTEDNISYTTIILIFCCYITEDDDMILLERRRRRRTLSFLPNNPSIVIIIITINNIFHNPEWRVGRGETNQLYFFLTIIPSMFLFSSALLVHWNRTDQKY